jgi:predicted nucleic acid-binding protein
MANTVYVDTSLLIAAFSNEPSQPTALALLQAPQWAQVCVSDWVLAEFACALHAKVLRGETSTGVAHTIDQTIKRLLEEGALQRLPVLREDYSAVQRVVPDINCFVRGADALHLAVAARSGMTHFASLDKTQRLAAQQWLTDVQCVPELSV